MMEHNMVGWVEIPVTDMDRAREFYEQVFNIAISIHDLGGLVMGWFPYADGVKGISGSLVKHEMYQPSEHAGVLIYFTCKDVAEEVARVAAAGGEVLRKKTAIGDGHGYMALIKDTEGNRIGLHSQS
jgi:predicted enzyme related to lactoylglutathione lyase